MMTLFLGLGLGICFGALGIILIVHKFIFGRWHS